DVGGTALGIFPDGREPILGESIRPGDAVIGIPSDGFHANGYTLLRKLLDREGVDLRRRRPGSRRSLAEELLRPPRIYAGPIESIAAGGGVHGLAHISGGGIRNLRRLRSDGKFVRDAWPRPAGLFEWITDLGDIDLAEAYETFNMGVGF